MKTKQQYKTLRDWFFGEFDKDEIRDIANNGADAGFHDIAHTKDCVLLHDLFQDQLWDMLYEDAKEFGYDNVPAFMATWARKDMLNDLDQMKNLIVWYAVEKWAHEVENA